MKLWKTILPKNTKQLQKKHETSPNLLGQKNIQVLRRECHTDLRQKQQKRQTFNRPIQKFSLTDRKHLTRFEEEHLAETKSSPENNKKQSQNRQQNQRHQNEKDLCHEKSNASNNSVVQEVLQFGGGQEIGGEHKQEVLVLKQQLNANNQIRAKIQCLHSHISKVYSLKHSVIEEIHQFLHIFSQNLLSFQRQYNIISVNSQNKFPGQTSQINIEHKNKLTQQLQQFYLSRIDELQNRVQTLQTNLELEIRIKEQKAFANQCKFEKIKEMQRQRSSLQTKLRSIQRENQMLKEENISLEEQVFMFQQKTVQIDLQISKRIEQILNNKPQNFLFSSEVHKKFYEQQIQQLEKQISSLKGKQKDQSKIEIESTIKKQEQLTLRESILIAKEKELQEGYLQFEKLIRDTDQRLKFINEKEGQLKQEYVKLQEFKSQIMEKEANVLKMEESLKQKQRESTIKKMKNEGKRLELGSNLECVESQTLIEMREKERRLSIEKPKKQNGLLFKKLSPKPITRALQEQKCQSSDFKLSLASKNLSKQKMDELGNFSNRASEMKRNIIQKSKSSSILAQLSPSKKLQNFQNSPMNNLNQYKLLPKKSKEVQRLNHLQNTLERLRKEIQQEIHEAY